VRDEAKNQTVIPLRFRRHLKIEPDYDLPKRAFRKNEDSMKHEERVASIVEKLEVTGGTVWLYSEATFQRPKIGQWAGFDAPAPYNKVFAEFKLP